MSITGGVFTIITNNGLQDKLIMATSLLNENIKKITNERLETLKKQNPKAKYEDLLNNNLQAYPTIADIEKTHIVFVNATFKPYVSIAHEYIKTGPRGGNAKLGQKFNFTMPVSGEFISDSVVHIQLEGLKAIDPSDKVRYVEMLGHRIMKNISFKLNQVVLDSYTSDRYNVYWQFKVPTDKEHAYLRNIGQEVPKVAVLTGTPSVDEHRQYRYYGNGPQTFKQVQPVVDMWIPLLFWFKDAHSSLPNFLFPHGQTDIEIELEHESKLVAYADYGVAAVPNQRIYNPPEVTKCELYMNNLYIDPNVHNIFKRRFGFQLIRVTRTHKQSDLQKDSDEIKLQQLKWPVECMYVAFRPKINYDTSYTWHRNAIISEVSYWEPIVDSISGNLAKNVAVMIQEDPVIAKLGIKIQDIVLYNKESPTFYNSYIPSQYGSRIRAPRDIGWNMVNFNLYPGDFQPSGYINTSLSRELYLQYESAIDPILQKPYIRDDNPVDLIVVAECINFLLSNNNSAVLKFST
jgi:hypothetical protein